MSDTTFTTGALANRMCVYAKDPCNVCASKDMHLCVCVDVPTAREVVVDCADERCTYDVRRFCKSCGGQLSHTNRASKCFFKKDSTSLTVQEV